MARNIINAYYRDEYIESEFKYFKALKDLKRIAKLISKEVNKPIEVAVHFVDANRIKELNKEHRDLNMSTDVLSFPHNEMDEKHLFVGDIFINIDIIDEQSVSIDSDPLTEVKFLFMHGILHLIGYDHIEQDDEKAMCKRQREIFTKLKIRNDLKDTDLV